MKAVIFDMDGVLIKSMRYHILSWKKAFSEFGIKPTDQELALYEGMSFKQTINLIAKEQGVKLSKEKKERLNSVKRKILSEIFRLQRYTGIQRLLVYLKKEGIKLAVVTGANRAWARRMINSDFKGFFDVVITGEDTRSCKPSPDPYLKAVRELKVKKSEILVIENSPLGIRSAKGAGLKVFALETTLDKEYLKAADRIFRNHEALSTYFYSIYLR